MARAAATKPTEQQFLLSADDCLGIALCVGFVCSCLKKKFEKESEVYTRLAYERNVAFRAWIKTENPSPQQIAEEHDRLNKLDQDFDDNAADRRNTLTRLYSLLRRIQRAAIDRRKKYQPGPYEFLLNVGLLRRELMEGKNHD